MSRPRFVLGSILVATTASSGTADTSRSQGSFDLAIGGGMLESASHPSSKHDVTGLGGGVEMQLGYRIRPLLAVGAYATVEAGNPTIDPSHRSFFGGTAGLRAEWHFDPSLTVDTWATVGAGMRWTSLADDRMSDATSLLGVEIPKLEFGGDFPVSSGLSIGPAVSFSASMFVADDGAGIGGYEEIDDKVLDLTITAGLRLRFSR